MSEQQGAAAGPTVATAPSRGTQTELPKIMG